MSIHTDRAEALFRRYYGKLPDTVLVDGRSIPIDTDFRVGILIFALLGDDTLQEAQKRRVMAGLYCGNIPSEVDFGSLMSALFSFFTMEKNASGNEDVSHAPPILDFLQDGELLVASFRQAYSIDLHEERLHWWQFLILLRGLPPDTALMQTIRFRLLDVDGIEDDHLRRQIRRAKAAVSLKNNKEVHW